MTATDRRFTPQEAAEIRAEYEAGGQTIQQLRERWDCGLHTIRKVLRREGCYSEEGERAVGQAETGRGTPVSQKH